MSQSLWGDKPTEFFHSLDPDTILHAVDKLGLNTTGRCLTLNSMENRVFEIEIDPALGLDTNSPSDSFVVAKFYRPGRWSFEQIKEEHQFLLELHEAECPVISPLIFEGETLFTDEKSGLFFCLFPKKGGRINSELTIEQIPILARQIARMHLIGQKSKSQHRLSLTPQVMGVQNFQYLKSVKKIPSFLEDGYETTVSEIVDHTNKLYQGINLQRIHGDCHWGNLIWRSDEQVYFIDFDDMMNGPCIQDLWLCLPGKEDHDLYRRSLFLEHYDSIRTLNINELKLIEPLRALRYLHFAAWLSKRYEDQAFKSAFPHFDHPEYWQTLLDDLNHQLSLM